MPLYSNELDELAIAKKLHNSPRVATMSALQTSCLNPATARPRASRRNFLNRGHAVVVRASSVQVNADPSADEVARCKSWPTWGCEASEFPWSYGSSETCYVIEGEAIVTPDDGSIPPVTLKVGTLATFPAGMSCTWKVTKAIRKHYSFN